MKGRKKPGKTWFLYETTSSGGLWLEMSHKPLPLDEEGVERRELLKVIPAPSLDAAWRTAMPQLRVYYPGIRECYRFNLWRFFRGEIPRNLLLRRGYTLRKIQLLRVSEQLEYLPDDYCLAWFDVSPEGQRPLEWAIKQAIAKKGDRL